MIAVKVTGVEEMKRRLRQERDRLARELEDAIADEGRQLLTEANQLAPRASGELVESAVVVAQRDRDGATAVVAYTDEKAAAVHEGVFGGHDTNKGAHFKWLERALSAFVGGFRARLAKRMRATMRGGA